MTVEEAALAMVDIVDAQLADLIRRVTVERGMDPASFAVFGYGGAAGLHVDSYASRLGCREVVIPHAASVFSALGIGSSDAKRVEMLSEPMAAPFELARWRRNFEALEERVRMSFETEHLPAHDLQTTWFVELQFRGQVHTVRVPVQTADLGVQDGGEAIIDRFATMYEARYGAGTAYRKAGVEAMTFVAEATARLPVPELEWVEADDAGAPAPSAVRPIHLGTGAAEDVQTYAARDLHPGHSLDGPLLVEAEDTTVLVRPDHRLWVDGLRNMRIDLGVGR
jgi:N-methylhydantoinase A